MITGSHSEPCINWPCAKGAGHAGPCGTSRDELSSKERTRLTDLECDSILQCLAASEWTGFTRDDIRMLDSVIREYRQPEPPSAWQPIETAPTLGKWVLLWWPDVTDAAFVGYCIDGQWRAATSGDRWPTLPGPTHWMPLPAGPAVTKNVLHCPHDKDPDDCMHCADRQPDETSELPEHLRDPFQVIERGNQILKEWGCDADEAPGYMGDINGPGCDPDTP